MRHPVAIVAAFVLGCLPLAAQCGLDWRGGFPPGGPSGQVAAIVRLPNGDLLAGGSFRYAGDLVVDNLARWNGTGWTPFGSPDGVVNALVVAANGVLYVGGGFSTIGGVAASRIARFDGTNWSDVGGGTDGWVHGLLVASNGDVYACGGFDHAGGQPANKVARWDGTTWSPLGTGVPSLFYLVAALDERPNGDIVIAGNFPSAGGVPAPGAARWDGFAWSSLGMSGLVAAQTIAALPNGDVAIGCSTGVWLSNGATAQPIGNAGSASRLRVAANGDLLYGGNPFGTPASSVARWNGTTWASLGSSAIVRDLIELPNGDLVTGGGATGPTAVDANAVQRWSGTSWSRLGGPPAPVIAGMVRTKTGAVVVGGSFTSIGGVAANRVATWTGSTWQPLGLGVDGPITKVAASADGVVVAGSFTTAGGVPALGIARWDGANWSALGSGMPLPPLDLAVAPHGDVFAVYSPTTPPNAVVITWWNGATWQLLPYYALSPGRIAVLPDGRLVSTFLIGGMAAWDGATWTPIAFPQSYVIDLEVLPDGLLYAVGSPAVQRWTGSGWQPLGGAQLTYGYGIAQLPNGDPVVTARTSSGAPAACRWDGSNWQTLGVANPSTAVASIAAADSGDLFVSGTFQEFAGDVTFGLALAVPTCPALVAPFGAGCVGGGGLLALATDDRPWLGTTMTSQTTGITTNSIALQAVGWQPLAVPLPAGGPGCALLLQPQWLDVLAPIGTAATANLVIPATTSLVGAAVATQTIVCEFGPGATLLGTASSNALAMRIGAL